MKNSQKKELLSKFKLVNSLERQQRFSEKVLRKLRSNNLSHNSSFQNDQMMFKQNKLHKTQNATPQTQSNRFFINMKEVQEQEEDLAKRKQEKTKFKEALKTQMSEDNMQTLRFQSLTSGKVQSSRKDTIQDNNIAKIGLKTLSSLLDMNCKTSQNKKRYCEECSRKSDEKDKKIELLTKQSRELRFRLQLQQEKFDRLKQSVSPYINNVNLMSAILESLTDKRQLNIPSAQPLKEVMDDNNLQKNELNQTVKVNMWLLKEGKQKAQHYHNQSYRLKCQLDSMIEQNASLKREANIKDLKIKAIQEQLKAHQTNFSLRQRMQMCREQLYSFKLRYQEKLQQNKGLSLKIDELKYKLNVLTSLIGCAIIFDINEKEKDNKCLNEVLNRIDKFEYLISSKVSCNGLEYLKMIQSFDHKKVHQPKEAVCGSQTKTEQKKRQNKITTKNEEKTKGMRKIYIPNYLILLGQQSISAKVQHIVIKPLLFIKMRSILDSKYIDFRLNKTSAAPFPQFFNSHLKHYQIQEAQKQLYLISRQLSQIEFKDVNLNFINQLMDYRIQDIPQIQIFRDFLFGKYEEDQIYFYLMCRHKFAQGNQLQNFINSGDPSKFIKYEKAKRTIIKITQNFGRNAQNFICHHLNEKKIIKGKNQFTKLYYILKLLLLVYRKVRTKKIEEFKTYFNNILTTTKCSKLNFMQFYELLKKNFEFLRRTQIVGMFRQAIAVFQSQKGQVQFYECFVATCITTIFLKELVVFDEKLQLDCQDDELLMNFKTQPVKPRKNKYKLNRNSQLQASQNHITNSVMERGFVYQTSELNKINELWPDSVYILGSQELNREYRILSKAKFQKTRTKIETLQFLLKIGMGHLVKESIHFKDRAQLGIILNDAIYNMIEFLNKVEKYKIERQNAMNLASKKIGNFFKNKTYEFYNQMLEDINNIKTSKQDQKLKKSKRYSETKLRMSKLAIN